MGVDGESIVESSGQTNDLLKGISRFESTVEVEREWRAHVDELFVNSLFPKAKSWFWGANVPGKPAQMLNYSGGVPTYLEKWDEVKRDGYAGFEFDREDTEKSCEGVA